MPCVVCWELFKGTELYKCIYLLNFVLAIAYVDTAEPEELLKLRIQMMLDLGCDAPACNLIGWCVQGQRLHLDIPLLVKRFDLLRRLQNLSDFGKMVGWIILSFFMHDSVLELQVVLLA